MSSLFLNVGGISITVFIKSVCWWQRHGKLRISSELQNCRCETAHAGTCTCMRTHRVWPACWEWTVIQPWPPQGKLMIRWGQWVCRSLISTTFAQYFFCNYEENYLCIYEENLWDGEFWCSSFFWFTYVGQLNIHRARRKGLQILKTNRRHSTTIQNCTA